MSDAASALFRDLSNVIRDDPAAVEKMVRVQYPRFRLRDRPAPKQDETPDGRNLTFLRSMAGLQSGPDRLLWSQGFSTIPQDPDSMNTAQMGHRLTMIDIKREAAEALRTDRDPCRKCGVRRDIGCKHNGGVL